MHYVAYVVTWIGFLNWTLRDSVGWNSWVVGVFFKISLGSWVVFWLGVIEIVEEVEVEDNNSAVLFKDWISSGGDFLSSRKQEISYALSGVMLLVIGGRSNLFLEFIVGW